MLLALPGAALAQFTFTTNNSAITITGYTGPGGAVTIPATTNGYPVTAIGSLAFYSQTSLTSVVLPSSVVTIGSQAFYYCANLTSATLGGGLTNISDLAFAGCLGLATAPLPNGLRNIGNNAFDDCESLVDVVLPGTVTNIGSSCFRYCYGLTNITVPASVLQLGASAFERCTNLTSATLALPNLKNQSFKYSGLVGVSIAAGVTNIVNSAFDACSSLTNIQVDGASAKYSSVDGVLYNKTQTTLLECPEGIAGSFTIPGFVAIITNSAFANCAKLTNAFIPDSVTNLGASAFFQCTGLSGVTIGSGILNLSDAAFEYTKIKNVIIPDTVKRIGDYAFAYSDIDSVVTGNGATNIGAYAFAGTYLQGLSIGTSVTDLGIYAFQNSAPPTLIIPNNVVTIGSGAFENSLGLTTLTLSTNLTGIGAGAFQGCSYLTSVTIPDSVTGIGNLAFSGCTSLATLILGNHVSFIGTYAFASCASLNTVVVPASVLTLSQYVFNNSAVVNATLNCPNASDYLFTLTPLTTATLGSAVTNIGNYTFYSCNYLDIINVDPANPVFSSVDGVVFDKAQTTLIKFPNHRGGNYVIPGTVKNIGNYAFYTCFGLTNVVIPEGVTNIGNVAFASTGLKNVVIPNSVKNIGTNAFSGCSSLTNATIGTGVTSVGATPFASCPNLILRPYLLPLPPSITNFVGSLTTIPVTVIAMPAPTYRWRRADTNLSNGGNIFNSTTATLTVSNLTPADAGSYTVVVSNSAGMTTSSVALLNVVIPEQLVQNGGFENPVTNWFVSGNYSGSIFADNVDLPFIHSGSVGLVAGPSTTLGYISQTLPTSPGGSYLLSFWLTNPSGGTPNQFVLSWNGTNIYNRTNLSAFTWTNLQFTVTATTGSTTLSFGFRNDPSYFGLDDVSVTPLGQPLKLAGLSLSGTNLVVSGLNGVSGASYVMRASTNLALPINQWTPVSTNILGVNGNFAFTATNAVSPGLPRQYYILEKR